MDRNPGTLRADQCLITSNNIIHGSDSLDSANSEISLWFKAEELTKWVSHSDDWVNDEK